MKKIAFLTPYLDTLGGGERYLFALASCLAGKNQQVDVFWPQKSIAEKAINKFGIDLKRVNFVRINLWKQNILKKYKILKGYDFSFFISDGSLPWLFAKNNIVHFQVPFTNVGGDSFLNKLKLKKINQVVCNSQFTKKFVDQEFRVQSRVIYPPVAIDQFKPGKKENIILYVGRFTDLLHNKRQDILVDVFADMVKAGLQDWKLVLVGSDKEGKKLVRRLKKKSSVFPIEIKTNLSFERLKELYAQAKIFWVASGFGVNEQKHPEKVEHFGITTVEAMASGCVPVVIKKGGQKEIIKYGENGFLWKTKPELVKLTQKLIEDEKLTKRLARKAQQTSKRYSQKKFCQDFERILLNLV